jgi:NADH-quinone oxidoreductase subunit G
MTPANPMEGQAESAIQESWRWLNDLHAAAQHTEVQVWKNFDEVMAAMIQALPVFQPVGEIAPSEGFRIFGQRIPREHPRYSGRTAMRNTVFEARRPVDPDSPLNFSMEGTQLPPPPALIPRFWAPGWNSVQSVFKFQEEIGGPLRGGDPGKRLLPAADGKALPVTTPSGAAFYDSIPAAFRPRAGALLALALYHVFGSEELSIHSPGVAELSPQPYIALHPADAQALGVQAGTEISITSAEARLSGQALYRAPVRLVPELPRGACGIPAGLPGAPLLAAPAWVKVVAP